MYEITVSDALKKTLNELAVYINARLPRGWGFTLCVFRFDPGKEFLYISNAQREDMIKALREFLENQEGHVKRQRN